MVPNVKPHARESGLVIEELEDELLIYDLDRHKAHCLNSTAALVWRQCDGKTGVQGIATRLRKEAQIPIDDEVVWVALRRLGKANLLRERVAPAAESFGSSRRDLIKKLAMAGGLSVITIISPTASAAATGCLTKVSCKHACIGDHNQNWPCNGVADQQNGKCCDSNPDRVCQNVLANSTNGAGTCTGAPCTPC